jgi:hypothetical protein
MPDKYTKFLMHGNSDREDFILQINVFISTEQHVVGSHSAKLNVADSAYLEWPDSHTQVQHLQ